MSQNAAGRVIGVDSPKRRANTSSVKNAAGSNHRNRRDSVDDLRYERQQRRRGDRVRRLPPKPNPNRLGKLLKRKLLTPRRRDGRLSLARCVRKWRGVPPNCP